MRYGKCSFSRNDNSLMWWLSKALQLVTVTGTKPGELCDACYMNNKKKGKI